MSDWVLVVVAMPTLYYEGGPDVTGQALEAYDPEAHDGRGDASFTDDPARAMRFPDVGEAMREWQRTSKTRPLRADGRPNRPLTAFSVSPTKIEIWARSLAA